MLNCRRLVSVSTAAVILGAVAAVAEPNPLARFSFVPVDAASSGPSGQGRFEMVVDRWSGPEERDRVLEAMASGEANLIERAVNGSFTVGHIKWPGGISYNLRYALRVPRSDGAEDVIAAVDRPMWLWWREMQPQAPKPFTVIQFRLDRQGRGEGKLSLAGKVGVDTAARTITIDDYASQVVVLTDVRRESAATN